MDKFYVNEQVDIEYSLFFLQFILLKCKEEDRLSSDFQKKNFWSKQVEIEVKNIEKLRVP